MKLTKAQRREKKKKELDDYWIRKISIPIRREGLRQIRNDMFFTKTPFMEMLKRKANEATFR